MVKRGKVVVFVKHQTDLSPCTQALLCFYDIIPSIKVNILGEKKKGIVWRLWNVRLI